ncbi:MAG: hypothetical protein M1828_003962 [Chrysothrix sp. TS-e1954]|nr:MAG: hypothetical protein M1828_003962 [Chrysothrix sp. TS-e1954]
MGDSGGDGVGRRSEDRMHLLKKSMESFDMANFSPAQSLVDPRDTPTQRPHRRSGYQRPPSVGAGEPLSRNSSIGESIINRRESSGLGISHEGATISFNPERHNPPFIYTVAGEDGDMPRSASALESGEPYSRPGSQHSSPAAGGMGDQPRASFQSGYAQSANCPSQKGIWISRKHHLAITLLLLSIFSTVFSGLYLLLALVAPRYERLILGMSYSTAQIVLALFAKLIEMSFVTVFVAFIGQVVSRRAFVKKSGHGVSLAEMSMRTWVLQPGTMLTNTASVRHALFTILGGLAFIAAIATSLYTTASNALVAPQLSFGDFKQMSVQGFVRSQWSNVQLVEQLCGTPIDHSVDQATYTCLAIEYAAESYYNYQQYIGSWTGKFRSTKDPTDLTQRPPGFAALNENTTVVAPWIYVKNMTEVSNAAGRLVNNVSMALPHAGVYQAAVNEMNGIPQPQGLDGLGAYVLYASVPSPVITTVCVNMSREELKPIVYEAWPGANVSADSLALWPSQVPVQTPDQYLNATAVDHISGLGPKYGTRRPHVFPVFPIDYNTLVNNTGKFVTADHLYILAKGGKESGGMYNLCSLSATITPFCSTQYNATSNGGTLTAHCEDPNDEMQYIRNSPNAVSGNITISPEFVDSADIWADSLSLGAGTFKGNSSNARFLTQLIPQQASLDPHLPSIAEALTVMAGNVALDGTRFSPFTIGWNYTNATLPQGVSQGDDGILSSPVIERFQATVKSQTYASGGVQSYQKAFYIILVALFLGNLLVLAWFIIHNGLVTDWCDPSNLFSLSINSPPSQAFAGSCGGGPTGDQFKARWFVNVDGEHIYLESDDLGEAYAQGLKPMPSNGQGHITKHYSKLSTRSSIL